MAERKVHDSETGYDIERLRVDKPRRGYPWYLMLVGLVLMSYFSINMIMNCVFAVDLSSDGMRVVQREAIYDDSGNLVREPEVIVLQGVSGWVEGFAPWLAVNGYIISLGALLFGLGYVMTERKKDKLEVSLFKMRILGCYLCLLALLMLALGLDRVFFIPHGPKEGVLDWMDWYILEFMAHSVWVVVLAAMGTFFLKIRMVDGGNGAMPAEA